MKKKKTNKYLFLLMNILLSSCMRGTEAWYFDLHLNGKDPWFLGVDQDKKIDVENKRKSALRFAFDYALAYKGFGCSSIHSPLSSVVFNRCFTLSDISLFLKLSNCNKVHITSLEVDEDPLDRCQRPDDEENEKRFGYYRSDLYTTLLAPVRVNIDAEQRQAEATITYLYRFDCKRDTLDCEGFVGLHLPIQSRLHIMNLQLLGGSLFTGLFDTNGCLLENSLVQFYRDYTDLYDFFACGILAPKKLCYKPRQRITGFGDLSAFGMLYFIPSNSILDFLQVGVNLVFPSGGKIKSDTIWEPYLGSGGAFQADFFTTLLFHTTSPYWNPAFRASIEASAPFTACFRVPQCKKNDIETQAKDIDDLLVPGPSTFPDFWVLPYQQLDTTIPWFADEAIPTKIRWGIKWILGFGNYFYDNFIPDFRLGVFYDFIGKKEDKYRPRCCNKQFCPQVLECYTKERQHRLSWHLAYMHQDWLELSIGSKHVVAGQNVAQTHEVHASLFITF